MKAALYCRVSSDRQREKQTIETQKRLLADYVKAQQWEVVDWYVDDGITGTSIEGRPAFTKLLREAEEGRFDVVVVVDIDRLTRSDDPRERAYIDYTLRENGIKVAATNTGELLDLDNPNHELIHSIKTWIAKEDRKKILQRMAEGRKTKVLRGEFPFAAPYGYEKVGKHLGIVESEAEVIREIHNLYLTGVNTVAISKLLTDRGYYRRKGGQWNPSRVAQAIRNPLYKGEYHSALGTIKTPSIVDDSTWTNAQKRLKANTTNNKRCTKRQYLVQGLIYCGECGSKMTAKTFTRPKDKSFSYYYCPKPGCAPYFPSQKVDDAVWALACSLVKDPNVLSRVLVPDPNEAHTIRAEIEKLESRLKGKHREKHQILRLYRKGLIPEDDIEQQLKEIQTAEDMIQGTKAIEERKLDSLCQEQDQLQALESGLARLRAGIGAYTFDQRQELVRLIVPGDTTHRIIAEPKTLTVNGIVDFNLPNTLVRKTAK